MKISNYAIDRPRIVTVLTLLVMLLAVFACLLTPVQRAPAISKAVILVAIPYPDSQPSEAENEIARKVEDALSELQSVDYLASTNMRGSSVTQIIFLDDVDPDDARREVKDLVDRIRNELPAGREVQPVITDIDFENMPLMLVSITAPDAVDDRTLKEIAEDVQEQLETVEGVANTQLFGGKEREIHVDVYPDRMVQYDVSLGQLRQALSDFHAEVPAGAFTTGEFDRQIRNESKLRSVDDIREAIVTSAEGRVIRVRDVAKVVDTHRKVLNLAQLNGQRSATIVVNKEADINTLGAADGVKQKVEDLRDQYPDLKFYTSRSASDEIWVMFRVLGSSAVFGAMLVLIILGWTMGLRISLLVLLAIPFSTAVGLVFLYATGIPISNMVVFSFILVLGMVVDGAIIVAENIHRHIERGEEPVHAAKVGIEEVGLPVIAADMTTIAAYLPMLLVPGIMGDFMGVMPKVVSVALVGSILVDHFIIPTLAARWYSRREPKANEAGAFAKLTATSEADESHEAARVRPNIGFFTRMYAWVLRESLQGITPLFIIIWCAIGVFGAGKLMTHLGFNFFPASDRGQFIVKYELPLGYSIEETLAASKVITDRLDDWKETGILVNYVTSVGSASAMATRVDDDPATGPEFGQVQVELVPPMDRTVHSREVMNYLRRNVELLPGMKMTIAEVQDGPPGGAKVSVRFTGKDVAQLGDIAKTTRDSLKQIPGTLDVKTDYRDDAPVLIIEPKPEVVGLAGLTEMQIARAVQTAIAGDTAVQITLDDEDINLRLQLAPEYQKHPEDLKRLLLTGPDGREASIGSLAKLNRDVDLFSVNRYERNRAVITNCDVDDSKQPAEVFGVLATEVLPAMGFRPVEGAEKTVEGYAKQFIGKAASDAEGVQAEFAGENDERDKNFGYLLNSMIIAVILIAAILVMQFNSFRQAVVVMCTVPLSFIGVILGMWATDSPFSLATFIGLVSLTGIVVNDAIVLVDFANQARKRGLSVRQSLVEAGVNRLRPVLLTTVTTCGGLLPLMLNISGGAEFWQPLTGAIVFGLMFATILTLLVIPCAYYFSYKFPAWMQCMIVVLPLTAIVWRVLYGMDKTDLQRMQLTVWEGTGTVLAIGLVLCGLLALNALRQGKSLVWNDC
ncbi:efflux RND transporter permease subunit [Aeoliella mucimassa]|uniref:Multidrug resistance protein MdtC n=1 Tax=Aeoliella mucimassa TaxID=2527972 RepID=A0A518AQQ7_9BACT|nr:efflux RND transporter permease subunit [Aeoliella mucimassa]QDU57059.1 Multidrug resistance protein MdtC [Aeoliella mucimassa]